MFVTDDTPNAESRYRARFSFDPNSIVMATNDSHLIFTGRNAAGVTVLQVGFRRSGSGAYQLRALILSDATSTTSTGWFTITDSLHSIEFVWWASAAAGANNGGLTLWIDGIQKAARSGIDNDTRRVDSVRLGAVSGIDTGTRGTYYFDRFESYRT
jgi:hypothetical protein